MTIRELHRLIRKGESQTVDFKKTVTRADKIAKTMVSFANTKGGTLIIGVLDDGRIIGTNSQEEAYALRQAAEHHCRPPVQLSFFEVEDELQQPVLLADIAESTHKPHEALSKNGEWRAYIRMHDKSVLASKELLLQLKKGVVGERGALGKEGLAVVSFLQKNERITAKILAQLINISDRRAKKLLIGMSQDGWLFSHGFEKETFYTLILEEV